MGRMSNDHLTIDTGCRELLSGRFPNVPVLLAPAGEPGGIPFWRFPGLGAERGLVHGVFSRHGGVSPEPFDTLNVAWNVGDEPGTVAVNRERIQATLGGAPLVAVNQVHGRDIRVIRDPADVATTAEADAMITDHPGALLMIQTADCQAILLYDAVTPALGMVHAGWRGSVQNLAARTVEKMTAVFGSRPESMRAAIGPSLGPCCGEFIRFQEELPAVMWSYRSGNYFDFWAITRDQLAAAGIPSDRIEIAGICTVCRHDFFFSYRAENRTGRFATVAGLIETAG